MTPRSWVPPLPIVGSSVAARCEHVDPTIGSGGNHDLGVIPYPHRIGRDVRSSWDHRTRPSAGRGECGRYPTLDPRCLARANDGTRTWTAVATLAH